MLNRLILLSFLVVTSPLVSLAPAEASGTNCWGIPHNTIVSGKYRGKALRIGRCSKAFFALVPGERSRNVRSEPTVASSVVGKLLEGAQDNKFATDLVVTLDEGRTYWAYGTITSADDSVYSRNISSDASLPGTKGWVEVGNVDAIRQFDRPQVNDMWFRF